MYGTSKGLVIVPPPTKKEEKNKGVYIVQIQILENDYIRFKFKLSIEHK